MKGAPGTVRYAMIKVVWVVKIYFLRVSNSPSTVVLVLILGIESRETKRLCNMTFKMLAEMLKLIYRSYSMQILAYKFMTVLFSWRGKVSRANLLHCVVSSERNNLSCLLPQECKYLESEEEPNFWNSRTWENQRPQSQLINFDLNGSTTPSGQSQ